MNAFGLRVSSFTVFVAMVAATWILQKYAAHHCPSSIDFVDGAGDPVWKTPCMPWIRVLESLVGVVAVVALIAFWMSLKPN
jgi:hypothetical protein